MSGILFFIFASCHSLRKHSLNIELCENLSYQCKNWTRQYQAWFQFLYHVAFQAELSRVTGQHRFTRQTDLQRCMGFGSKDTHSAFWTERNRIDIGTGDRLCGIVQHQFKYQGCWTPVQWSKKMVSFKTYLVTINFVMGFCHMTVS